MLAHLDSPADSIRLSPASGTLEIDWRALKAGHGLFVLLGTDPLTGSAVVPYGHEVEGSTVFLPFRATRLYIVKLTASGPQKWLRHWQTTQWGPLTEATGEFEFSIEEGRVRVTVSQAELGSHPRIKSVFYEKDLAGNLGWGTLITAGRHTVRGGHGDQCLNDYLELDRQSEAVTLQSRLPRERVRIYQLLPRLFGNVCERRKPNGTLAENGVGKFADINNAALTEIREMGFTHLWLTGVLRQATSTDYRGAGLPADDADLLKGLAGSPYAIKDYFDVCPDYAVTPTTRMAEFQALLARIHSLGLRAIIDFVPNHVSRTYHSTVRPELSFGTQDNPALFCDPANNFFYLAQVPLKLPTWKDGEPISATCKVLGTCDGQFEGEIEWTRVTGNNVVSASPELHDWYETVKLNYGFDFTSGTRTFPHGSQPEIPVPDTWLKMDQVLAYWQAMGVDGFRCDMSHMVPPEFWGWAIGRARARDPKVFFCGEAYDRDPMKVPGADPLLASLNGGRGNVMFDLLSAGFDAVYDDPAYKALKAIYDGSGWANDLDQVLGHEYIFQNSLRYAENHDEVRLAGHDHWGNSTFWNHPEDALDGMHVGRAVSAILFGLSRGPILLYSGQEVGEPAEGAEGFGGDDARTSIFDYWSMPELVKWANHHRYDGALLSTDQKNLRQFYSRLVRTAGQPAFASGDFFGLNPPNADNPAYGRLGTEAASGHWFYAFLRYAPESGQRFVVVVNLHRSETMHNVLVKFSTEALEFLGLPAESALKLTERLQQGLTISIPNIQKGLFIDIIPPLTPYYFELEVLP